MTLSLTETHKQKIKLTFCRLYATEGGERDRSVYEVETYIAPNGKVPFEVWLNTIKSTPVKAMILHRIDRLRFGNFGDCKPIGGGVNELRIHYGPGFRVYYAISGKSCVLLLAGVTKSTQAEDMRKSHLYWRNYNHA